MKYNSLTEKHNKLRALLLDVLYPELFEILDDMNIPENFFIYFKRDNYRTLALNKNRTLFLENIQGGGGYTDCERAIITKDYCPYTDTWTKAGEAALAKYVASIIVELEKLKTERRSIENALDEQIKSVMTIPSVCTRKVLVEKFKENGSD